MEKINDVDFNVQRNTFVVIMYNLPFVILFVHSVFKMVAFVWGGFLIK